MTVAKVFNATIGLSFALGVDLSQFAFGFIAHGLGSGGFDLPALLLLGENGQLGLVVGIFQSGQDLSGFDRLSLAHEDFLDFSLSVSHGLGQKSGADFALGGDAEWIGNQKSG
jgi:hypothetical protein